MVLHQTRNHIRGRLRSRVDEEVAGGCAPVRLIVRHDKLLAPVAQQVGLQARSSLGGVAGLWLAIVSKLLEYLCGIAGRIPNADAWRATVRCVISAVERLVKRVAGPVDAEVGVRL